MANCRTGFTIVEILVVIGIIGVLLALILPATLSARGAARKLDCQNRLRQFGVALTNFEAAHRHLPYEIDFPPHLIDIASWAPPLVRLLPYLEQTPAFESIRQNIRNAKKVRLPVLHCPDEEVRTGTSYRMCTGMNLACLEHPNVSYSAQLKIGFGAMIARSNLNPPTLAEITDGLSNTAAMSERTISHGPGNTFQADRDIWYSGAIDVGFDPSRPIDDAVDVCKSLNYTPTESFNPFAGRDLMTTGAVSTYYNHAAPPNPRFSDCSMDSLNQQPEDAHFISGCNMIVSARSNHLHSIVNVLLMDGSVQSISPSIDLIVWRATATRAGDD